MNIELEVANTAIRGGYVGVLLAIVFLGYRLLDKWAAKIVVALTEATKAFGELTGAIRGRGSDPASKPAPGPPPSQRGKSP